MDGYNFVTDTHKSVGIKSLRPDGDGLEAQLAFGSRLSESAFQIRYQGYRSYGYVGDRPDGLFSDAYDAQANCRTAVVFKHGTPAATVRIAVYDPASTDSNYHKMPAMEIFGNEIRATMAALTPNCQNRRAVEIGRLARLPAYAKDIDIVFALFRTAGYLILHSDADVVFNAVRAHHISMYRRFGFQQLEKPKLYPGLTCKMGLMACFRPNFAHSRDNLPFLKGISKDDASYAGLIAGERVKLFDEPRRNEPPPNHTAPYPDRLSHHRTGAADQRIGL